jgi:hypothetical protein
MPVTDQERSRETRLQPAPLRLGSPHHDDRRRAVVDLRRVARCHGAALAKGRLQLAEVLDGRAGAGMLVAGERLAAR